MKRTSLFIITAFLLFFPCGCYAKGPWQGKEINAETKQPIEIANNKVKSLGYDLNLMRTKVDKYDTPWNKYIPKNYNDDFSVTIKNKLKNKEYWAIYYYPKRLAPGGDVCIFIDTTTGEIIAIIRGK